MNNPFAVFAVANVSPSFYAATTRAADRGESGKIGLPGGKVDAGETPVEALIRESKEEGFVLIGVSPNPIHSQLVDGKLVQWFRAEKAIVLQDYKEIGRIKNIVATKKEILNSGYGNENLKELF